MIKELWFPLPIWYANIDEDFSAVTKKLLALPSTDAGVSKSNRGGYQSNSITEIDDPDIQHMLVVVKKHARQAIQDLDPIDNLQFDLANSWVNINYADAYNVPHSHPQASFSGVLYLIAPENSGNLVFKRNDLKEHYLDPGFFKNFYDSVSYTPVKNMFVLFPAWLEHYVNPNLSGEIRLSVAFNFHCPL
jgi:uncharacterized protein (TIGR02466 family)